MTDPDPILQRMEDQIVWYDRKSATNQRAYKRIKMIVIASAALIPFLTGLSVPYEKWIVGGLGVLIAVMEGVLQLNQYPRNWIAYRATCDALQHEKYLYLAGGGPYAGVAASHALLAERVESLISQENVKWATQQQQDKRAATGT